MRKNSLCKILMLALLSAVSTAAIPAADAMASPYKTNRTAAPRYEAVDLGMPEGAAWVWVAGASPNARYVVGYVSTHTILRAFVWHEGVFRYLSTRQSAARAVNDSGTVVGELIPHEHESHAVVWSGRRMTRLFSGTEYSRAEEIDSKGNIYGTHLDQKDGLSRAYLRSPNRTITHFETSPEHRSSFRAASQRKQVVFGIMPRRSTDTKDAKTFVWEKNKLRELPRLKAGQPCFVQGINDTGTVVGYAFRDPYTAVPVTWRNGKITLVKAPKIFAGWARGINNRGNIVGEAAIKERYPLHPTPFLIHGGTFYDIHDLLVNKVEIHRLLQISDTGIILADGSADKKGHAFLLRPVRPIK